jgi:hypothetical protein
MKKHPVVISSNKVNRYGFRMLTSGGDLEKYKKNPVLLYAHRRPDYENPKLLPIGKIEDIRLQNEEIVGDLLFDEDDDFAVAIEKKWEKGMLNAVSIGAEVVGTSENPALMLPGQKFPTVTEWILDEVSVVDIPADEEAVAIRLHRKDTTGYVTLTGNETTFNPELLFPPKPKPKMKLIQLALKGQQIVSLAADATEEQIAEALTGLVNKANEAVNLAAAVTAKDQEIERLTKEVNEIKLAAVNDKATALVDGAIAAKKITAEEKDSFVELAKTNYDAVKKILDAKKGFTSVTEELNKKSADAGEYATLNFRELEQKGLAAKLKKEDPELFKTKFKDFYGTEYKGEL